MWMAGQHFPEPFGELRPLELHCVDIHAHRYVESLIAPTLQVCKRTCNDPLPEFDNQQTPFHDGQEVVRHQETQLGVSPADQGFGAQNRSGAHAYLRLKIQFELLRMQRLADALQVLATAAHGAVEHGIEHVVACARGPFWDSA